MNLSGSGEVVMTDVRRVSAGVTLAENIEGRLFVRSADRRLDAPSSWDWSLINTRSTCNATRNYISPIVILSTDRGYSWHRRTSR
jgi:hypothetical protein